MSRLLHVTVALWLDDEADPDAVMEGLDYSFDHPAIKGQEIIDFEERRQRYSRTIGQMPLDL